MLFVTLVAIAALSNLHHQGTTTASQIVKASEYDDYLRTQQSIMSAAECKRREAKRTPDPTLYTKYPADCDTMHIPIRLLILQTIRRKSRYGALAQPDIDELHQEVLHYLYLKNAQLLTNVLMQPLYGRLVENMVKFHRYLSEYYGGPFVKRVYETSIDTFVLSHFEPGILVEYLRLIYRKNTEASFRTMVQALLYLSRKLERADARHLRDYLHELTDTEEYYELLDNSHRERIVAITARDEVPNYDVGFWRDLVLLNWEGAPFVESMESVMRCYTHLLDNYDERFVQEIFMAVANRIWNHPYYISLTKWNIKYLHMIYQAGNVDTFKLMVDLQLHSNEIYFKNGFDFQTYNFQLGYFLRDINRNRFYAKLDRHVKRNISETISRLPGTVYGMLFYESLCFVNKQYGETVLTDPNGGMVFTAEISNNINEMISIQLDALYMKAKLQSYSQPGLFVNINAVSAKTLHFGEEASTSHWLLELSEEKLRISQNKYSLCCFEKANASSSCYVDYSLFPKYETDNCLWTVRKGVECDTRQKPNVFIFGHEFAPPRE